MIIYRTVLLTGLLMLICCEEPNTYSGIPEEEMVRIRSVAGVTARHWVIHPSDSSRPPLPVEAEIAELMEVCEEYPEAWSYFYACVADTIATIEPPEPSCQRDFSDTYELPDETDSLEEIGENSLHSHPGDNP
ncbi:MAG: hypothetical protein GF388_11675 [Candidatus Aegiribacteria sp.]|nr:hypothetical protein [Candidatus Aegiribacteria sp.]MBD3295640.1 hypothetical protein [Candidatus Fermentibacteria bacterium]